MKYLCLVYFNEEHYRQSAESPQDHECFAYSDKLKERGVMVDGAPLEPVVTATTVRVRDGKVTVTDGPFAETKEQLAGFYMIDAANLDEAIEIAGGIPPARVGSIEIRPVRELQV